MKILPFINFPLFTVLVGVSPLSVSAQVSAVAYDMETGCAASGVTVYLNPKGSVVTDMYGRFSVPDSCNSVTLSHPNYESLSLDVAEIADALWLLPKSRRLDEVIIYGVKPKAGFDIGRSVRSGVSGYGNAPSGMDFLSIFNVKASRQAKRRKEIKKVLDKY